ncbi:unnamed protein product [Dimorphilus gyrociliatus]|nr:unnamed protein product [Dimorphilus gyrociliatus]
MNNRAVFIRISILIFFFFCLPIYIIKQSGLISTPNIKLLKEPKNKIVQPIIIKHSTNKLQPESDKLTLSEESKNGYLPKLLDDALNNQNTSGFLIGNATFLKWMPYERDVELRVIVLAYNRPKSLLKCLKSLSAANYLKDKVAIDVWIDRNKKDQSVHEETLKAAKSFEFPPHISYKVRVQEHHRGILGQWVNTWRPGINSKEVGLILEDDLSVSSIFWLWLKAVTRKYRYKTDVSGYSLSKPSMAHAHGGLLFVPDNAWTYMYRLICTWSFSPHPESWRNFQKSFYISEHTKGYEPQVSGVLPSQWWKGEQKKGKERDLWEMWHIAFAHEAKQFTVLLNTHQEGLLAVNRREVGLHDSGGQVESLCNDWNDMFEKIPEKPIKLDYDGTIMKN